jgi:hypothetical protein
MLGVSIGNEPKKDFVVEISEKTYGSQSLPGRRFQAKSGELTVAVYISETSQLFSFLVFLRTETNLDGGFPFGERSEGIFCDFEMPKAEDGSYTGQGYTGVYSLGIPVYDSVCTLNQQPQ